MVWKGSLRPDSSSPFPWAGAPATRPTQRPIHNSLEYFQGAGMNSFSGQQNRKNEKWLQVKSILFFTLYFYFSFLLNQTGDSLVPETVHLRKCLLSPHFKTKFIWDIFLKWNWSWVSAQALCEMLTLYKKTGEQISSVTTVYKGNCNLDFVLPVSEGQRSIRWVLYIFVCSSTFLRCPTA